MGTLTMDRSEREDFLAALHVGVLAVERPDRPPLVSPVWYRYSPGGVVELNTESASIKASLLEAAGRATLCAQREELPYAYVTVEGPVTITPATTDIRIDIATRYLGESAGRAYVEGAAADDITVSLTPQRWYTADFAKLGG